MFMECCSIEFCKNTKKTKKVKKSTLVPPRLKQREDLMHNVFLCDDSFVNVRKECRRLNFTQDLTDADGMEMADEW